jgi:hypothetical protein
MMRRTRLYGLGNPALPCGHSRAFVHPLSLLPSSFSFFFRFKPRLHNECRAFEVSAEPFAPFFTRTVSAASVSPDFLCRAAFVAWAVAHRRVKLVLGVFALVLFYERSGFHNLCPAAFTAHRIINLGITRALFYSDNLILPEFVADVVSFHS